MTRVLMLGWEFPPIKSGGLGVASRALAEALSRRNIDLTFILPSFIGKKVKNEKTPFRILSNGDKISFDLKHRIQTFSTSIYSPYIQEEDYQEFMEKWYEEVREKEDSGEEEERLIYGKNLFQEIERYTAEIEQMSFDGTFDLIHAHDWITCPAALCLKRKLGLPLVIHVHATEYDRTGGNINHCVYQIEKEAWEQADKLICVSNYTRNIVIEKYGIDPNKIEVVHNGKDDDFVQLVRKHKSLKDKKTVLFLGRLTLQKGPDWFLKIAEKVLGKHKNVQFLIAGTGDMMPQIVKEIVKKGFQKDIFCIGFLGSKECDDVFANSDVFVMPSVSEPFGLVALEAAQRGCAVILSSQSGVKEVLKNSLHADFWDVDKIANYILASLEYPVLKKTLTRNANKEIQRLTWDSQAKKAVQIYNKLI